MPEKEFEKRLQELEADPLFRRLWDAGVIALDPYPRARFAARRAGGWELRTSKDGLSDLLNGRNGMVDLIQAMGREKFERYFLGDKDAPDEERAGVCGISCEEARSLREMVERLYIQAEFENPASDAPPPKVFSVVAVIELDNGKPVIAFFHREIWKGRYRISQERRVKIVGSLSPAESRRLDGFLRQLEFVDHRKTTLYRVLEALLEAQADFLISGDPERRRSLTQRALAAQLNIAPGVLNSVISNKSISLPSGIDAPIKSLMPSSKSLLLGHLYQLATDYPALSDEGLVREIGRLYAANLSRRSVAQYRNELGLGGSGCRAST